MILASVPPTHIYLSIITAVAYALPAIWNRKVPAQAMRAWVGVAWVFHAITLGWLLLGEKPYFGFAPALSLTAWLTAAFYAVEAQIFFPQLPTRWSLAAFAGIAVLLALLFPGAPLPDTASPWLPVHLVFGVACYGLFGLAVAHAWFMTRAEARIRKAADPHSGLPLLTLERLTYRFVSAGFVLLSATLLIGYFFGDAVRGHGNGWRWDHKTVFSLLSWITIAVLLIGRGAFGWRGKRAVHVLYAGSIFLLLAYVGSRFVLEVLLGRMA